MSDEAILIPIVALAIPVVVVPTAIVVKFLHRRSERRHQELMHALDLGHPPGSHSSTWPAAWAAIGLGVVVPLGCFFLAWMAALSQGSRGEEAFFGATVVSIVGIVTGSRLALRILDAAPGAAREEFRSDRMNHTAKPAGYDPDALDVVSRRG
jgi:hypothetical protein